MDIVFVSQSADFRTLTAKESLAAYSNKVTAHAKVLQDTHYELSDTTSMTLASLDITPSEHAVEHLTSNHLASSVVIAMDESTRNDIQQHFGVLVPLFNEVAHNIHTEILAPHHNNQEHATNHAIDMIHHIHNSTPKIFDRSKLFHPISDRLP